ncbi:MAG: N-acetylglucosamine-6-phosphate deacetylase [Thermomicrobiales bacterium]
MSFAIMRRDLSRPDLIRPGRIRLDGPHVNVTLRTTRLIDADGERPGVVGIDAGILRLLPPDMASPGTDDETIDLGDAPLVPGYVDVHVHGGGGFALHTTDPHEIAAFARWAPRTGVTSFLIAVVGVEDGLPEAQLRTAAAVVADPPPGAEAIGIHLEGPFMEPSRRGAHPLAWLRTPSPAATDAILAAAGDALRLVTLAPELPGAGDLIDALVARGITASAGHTAADEAQTEVAFARGVTHVTHCFNAMPPMLHRAPGPTGALVASPHVRGELIADGVHVHEAAARLLARALGPDRLVLITDALPAAGMGDGPFLLGSQPFRVERGVARMADGALAGSTMTMDAAVPRAMAWGFDLAAAVTMATRTPARAVGLDRRKGVLRDGFDADLVILAPDLSVAATICRGRLAHVVPGWADRLAVLPTTAAASAP